MADMDVCSFEDAAINEGTDDVRMQVEAEVQANPFDNKLEGDTRKKSVKSLARLVEEGLLNDIKLSVDKYARSATFACGGNVPFKKTELPEEVQDVKPDPTKDHVSTTTELDPIQIRFGENGKGISAHFPTGDDRMKELQDLIAACQPATFGRGKEDVLDEGYRKAGKLERTAFATTFCPYEAGTIDIVAQLLLPQLKYDKHLRSVRAELYKLNVYSAPNGKFKAHVDTPRSNSQFGSLVVALPVSHEGGGLVVRNAGKEVVFDWSTSKAEHEKETVKWAAFYSDCEHEVYEVTGGHRVTLTYNLYATRGLGHLAGAESGLDATQLPMYEALHAALQVPKFLRRGRVLAVWLSHSYAHTSKHTNFLPSSLKGADMSLYETARALGLKCVLVPIITHDHSYYDSEDEYKEERRQILQDEFNGFNEGLSFRGYQFDEEYNSGGWGSEMPAGKVIRINDSEIGDDTELEEKLAKEHRHKNLKEAQMAHIAYGNQPDIGVQYSRAAILIRIPPYHERGIVKIEPNSVWAGIEDDNDED